MLLGLLLVVGCAWAGQGQGDNEDARGVEALYYAYIVPALPHLLHGLRTNDTYYPTYLDPLRPGYKGSVPCGSRFDRPDFMLQPSDWLFIQLQCSNDRVVGLLLDPYNQYYRSAPGRPPRPTISLLPEAIQHFSQLRLLEVAVSAISSDIGPALASLEHLEVLYVETDYAYVGMGPYDPRTNIVTFDDFHLYAFAPPDWSFLPATLRNLTMLGPVAGGSFASFLMSNDSAVVLPDLTELILHGVEFTDMLEPGLDFSRFPNITKLELINLPEYMRDRSLPSELFAPLNRLEVLWTPRLPPLSSFPPGPAASLKSLELSFVDDIGLLNRSPFAGFESLQRMGLSYVNLTEPMPEEAFQDVLPALESFRLSGRISLPLPDSLSRLPSLKSLYMTYNSLTNDGPAPRNQSDPDPLYSFMTETRWPESVEGSLIRCRTSSPPSNYGNTFFCSRIGMEKKG